MVDAVDGIERIRYTSPHPKDMREDVIRAHAELPRLCEHIHLPLQSGSSRILKAMRRTYNRERYIDRVALIREHVPDCALTTDIIVGFPGETEDDFEETLEVVEQVRYDSAFTFIFSPRRGTAAADLAGPAAARGQARADGAARRGRAADRATERAQRFVGRTMEVLVEGPSRTDPSRLRGRTRHNKTVNFDGRRAAGRARGRGDRVRHQHHAGRRGEPAGAGRPERARGRRDLRADGRRQDGVAVALAELLRARGEDPVAISADALQVYRGPRDRSRARRARTSARGSSTGCVGFVPVTETFSVGEFMPLAHAEIDAALAAGRRPIVVGGTGLYLRAALTDLDLRPPPPAGLRERLEGEARRARAGGAARRARASGRRRPRPRIEPADRSRVIRAARAARDGRAGGRAAGGRVAAVDGGHAPADAARRPDDGARARCTSGSTRAWTRWWPRAPPRR